MSILYNQGNEPRAVSISFTTFKQSGEEEVPPILILVEDDRKYCPVQFMDKYLLSRVSSQEFLLVLREGAKVTMRQTHIVVK